jgi:hypothetical protein
VRESRQDVVYDRIDMRHDGLVVGDDVVQNWMKVKHDMAFLSTVSERGR